MMTDDTPAKKSASQPASQAKEVAKRPSAAGQSKATEGQSANHQPSSSARSAKRRSGKVRASSERGRVYIQATFNNTLVSFTDADGQVVTWGSAGTAGFKGSRKSTPYAATVSTQRAAEIARKAGLKTVDVFVRGVGSGRDAAVRALQSSGLTITSMKDVTPIPHNGVRARKPRRV